MVNETTEQAVLIRLEDLEARLFAAENRIKELEASASEGWVRAASRNWQSAATRLRETATELSTHTQGIDHEDHDDTESQSCSRGGREPFTRAGFQTGLPRGCLATGEGWAQAEASYRHMADLEKQVWPITAPNLKRGEPD